MDLRTSSLSSLKQASRYGSHEDERPHIRKNFSRQD
jgi:hypothetical protein